MAGEAIAHRGRMDGAFDVGRFFVVVTGEAKTRGSCSDELDAGDVFIDAHFVASQTTHRHGGVNVLAFGFIVMTLGALGSVSIFIEGNGMQGGGSCSGASGHERDAGEGDPKIECQLVAGDFWIFCAYIDVMREKSHSTSDG